MEANGGYAGTKFAYRIFNYSNGSPERVFWDSKLPTLLANAGIDPCELPCLVIGVCEKQSDLACTCEVIRGNSANLLDTFYDQFQSTSRHKMLESVDDSVRSEWLRLGKPIASWCCGDQKLRL